MSCAMRRVCAIVVLASDVSRYRFAEQLVRWLVSRLEETDISSEFGVRDATAMLRNSFPDLTAREAEVLWAAVAGEDYHGIAGSLGIQPATARNRLARRPFAAARGPQSRACPYRARDRIVVCDICGNECRCHARPGFARSPARARRDEVLPAPRRSRARPGRT